MLRRQTGQDPRKLNRPRFLHLSAALLLAIPLTAAPLQHGTGYRLPPRAVATWYSFGQPTIPATRVLIDQSALPWGASGVGPLDNAAYTRRYAGGEPELARRGGMTPQGEANERSWHTDLVLAAACDEGVFGPGWDCKPTAQEREDYAFTTQRGTGLYQRYASLFAGPVTPPAPTPPLPAPIPAPVPVCPTGQSFRPAPVACPPPAACPACPTPICPAEELLPVPADILDTIARLAQWPIGRKLGVAMASRLGRLKEWVGSVEVYRPGIASTGRLDVAVVPRSAPPR